MTQKSVLIAAFSGRSLAASASRAGFAPLVVDSFGDDDMGTCAKSSVRLPSALGVGFRKKSLGDALAKLNSSAMSPPIGLVLGPGFEEQPDLICELADRFTILGSSGPTVARSKDPTYLFPLLRDRGIPHPETVLSPPSNPDGWILKHVGGSGGLHITACPAQVSESAARGCYFQRAHEGIPFSVAGVVSPQGFAIGVCRQWLSPLEQRPYRFGGIVSPAQVDPDSEARMVEVAVELTRALDLKGFVSFDFLVTDTDVLFLEVNPRPTAALDILDDGVGNMFNAHIAACLGDDPCEVVSPRSGETAAPRPSGSRAVAYLYADRGELLLPHVTWPEWSCDRPQTGSKIGLHRPLATVTATASSDIEAQNLCHERLGELEVLLYGGAR